MAIMKKSQVENNKKKLSKFMVITFLALKQILPLTSVSYKLYTILKMYPFIYKINIQGVITVLIKN